MGRKRTTSEFIQKANEVHRNFYTYDKVDYIHSQMNVIITCRAHGDFKQLANTHLAGKGCSKCKGENLREILTYSTEEFIKKAIEIHGLKYTYHKTKYINSKTKVVITCHKHGDFEQLSCNHLFGKGCLKCRDETIVSKIGSRWLDYLGIPDDPEHREVKGLIPGRRFSVDGFVPETRTVYEFYGDHPHGNPSVCDPDDKGPYRMTYGELYQRTISREQILKDAGFGLITMWESDFRKQVNGDCYGA